MSAQFLYVARYDLAAGHKFVLLFKEGDLFIPIPSCSNNPNWAVCVDTKGNIGYVPYTYVTKRHVSKDELLWFIDDILEKLHTDSPTSISKLTREVISDLTRRRAELGEELTKEDRGSKHHPIEETNADVIGSNKDSEPNKVTEEAITSTISPQHKIIVAEDKHQTADFVAVDSDNSPASENSEPTQIHSSNKVNPKSSAECSTQTDNVTNMSVPNWLVPTLIENVRYNTQLSFENSKTAIDVVFNTFVEALPYLNSTWCQLREHLNKLDVIQDSTEIVIQSEDKKKLFEIFKQLWYCKNDEQQRSWPVHEDEEIIGTLLSDMNTILMDANPRVTREVVQCDGYEMVNTLITYYQMEPRRTLRVKMLHVFLTLCELDLTVITCLLSSVLPTELARDLQDNFEDEEKVQYSCYLLTLIFSSGEQPPRGTYDFINKKFLDFLFQKLEEVVKEGQEDMGQNLLNVILAFNLHFQDGQDNLILETLKERLSAQVLTEKLVFLLNREEDPLQILPHDKEIPNSVLKFMVDLFSVSALFDLFYLNDIKVLLDIVVRQLSDLLPGEKMRLEYLMLVKNLLKNSNYGEHMHQVDGLRKCFETVLGYEVPEENEVEIILNIMNEFQCWFNGK